MKLRSAMVSIFVTVLLAVLTLGGFEPASAAPFAYITNSGGNTVSVIDTATNAVTATVNVGNYPFGVAVAPDGARVYVANYFYGGCSVISTSTTTVPATMLEGLPRPALSWAAEPAPRLSPKVSGSASQRGKRWVLRPAHIESLMVHGQNTFRQIKEAIMSMKRNALPIRHFHAALVVLGYICTFLTPIVVGRSFCLCA